METSEQKPEQQSKPKWGILSSEVYQISSETKNKSLRIIQQKLKNERHISSNKFDLKQIEPLMAEHRKLSSQVRESNFLFFQKQLEGMSS